MKSNQLINSPDSSPETRLCIIPARGGSKRIPGKNIKEFCGKPLLAYSIEAAIDSELFSKIIVSTDSSEIAKVAEHYGVVVPHFRSEVNSSDFATIYDVLKEVLTRCEIDGFRHTSILCLLATAPFVTPADLREGYKTLTRSSAKVVCPVVPFESPIQRALRITRNQLEMIEGAYRNTRTQDLETAYFDAGQWYWIDYKDGLLPENLLLGPTEPKIISPEKAQDIDTIQDWHIAEMKYKNFSSELRTVDDSL